ncbi:FixH family protein [Paracoccus beibuensis]|uniref:FixH family protein n=1 Tax=Paracoccus beibuensis TaxID=547602 RepID=UPI00223ED645|nr:FixH family protein [Paracoccus beibuensis]
MTKELKGFHVLLITLAAFGTIIAVNVVMAINAIGSFPGIEVRSAYVASQHFEADRAAQQALGWTIDLDLSDDRLTLRMRDADGQAVQPRLLDLMLRRPTHQMSDQHPRLRPEGDGVWVSQVDLATGNWNADLFAESRDGTSFRLRLPLHVKE